MSIYSEINNLRNDLANAWKAVYEKDPTLNYPGANNLQNLAEAISMITVKKEEEGTELHDYYFFNAEWDTAKCRYLTALTLPWDNNAMKYLLTDICLSSMVKGNKIEFSKYYNLSSIAFDGLSVVKSIKFQDCDALTKIRFNSLTSITGTTSFSKCDNLEEIYFPRLIQYKGTFGECPNLKKVNLDSLEKITKGSFFSKCANLSSVTLPNVYSVNSKSMFYGCKEIRDITFGNLIYCDDGPYSTAKPELNITCSFDNTCVNLQNLKFSKNLTNKGIGSITGNIGDNGNLSIDISNNWGLKNALGQGEKKLQTAINKFIIKLKTTSISYQIGLIIDDGIFAFLTDSAYPKRLTWNFMKQFYNKKATMYYLLDTQGNRYPSTE